MAFSRRLGVVWIAGVSWLVAVGCNDDDDKLSQTSGAGEAGEAPSAGKSSVAGSQNNGGKAGSSAGSAGKGGTASGGNAAGGEGGTSSAGQSGSGNHAGAGGGWGPLLGGAGAGGAEAGQGGQAGQGGDGVVTAPAPHCSFTCASDDDCLIDGDDAIKCNLTTHACEDPTTACTVDANCLPSLSFWFKPCTDDTFCTADTEACVAAGDQGFCATLPDVGDPACDAPNVAKTLPRFGAQGNVSVCAHPDARCFSGVCRPGCGTPNVGCGLGNGDTCSAVTGLCGCSSGTECTATGICGSNGQCQECVTNEECAENVTDTVCVGGKCGCATADACSALDPGYASAAAACQ